MLETKSREEVLAELIDKKFPVSTDGFISLVDVMGDDERIVAAARTSYGKGTKSISDTENLIRFLMRHDHMTPFEMGEICILVRVPMDTWRQWIRQRTASVNEYSTRYSEAIDSMEITDPDKWRKQSTTNKQGSGDFLDESIGKELTFHEANFQAAARQLYEGRLAFGVSREQARKDLPLCTYTQAYWKIDLLNLLKFLLKRMAPSAQKEIRDYATVLGEEIVKPLFPLVWQAFQDYWVNSVKLSARDIEVVQRMVALPTDAPYSIEDFRCTSKHIWSETRSRERDECWAKLLKIGLVTDHINDL